VRQSCSTLLYVRHRPKDQALSTGTIRWGGLSHEILGYDVQVPSLEHSQKLTGDDKVEDIGCLTALSAVRWRRTSGEVHNSESIWMHGDRSCHRCQIPLITVAGILTTFTAVHKTQQHISKVVSVLIKLTAVQMVFSHFKLNRGE